ncbi:hypothetical protein EYF80_031714 [Liparis tanakae]|uniref:Uncharacterized protein n=1 Tax=Liparis tanakae TaxID=230148 RepID=A0A4Z2GZG6_9TELE|nr:hypothetical protein EYF80_031714 [Liparis tanakae]
MSPYLRGVVGLLLALRPRLAGAGLLSELLQTGLQLQLLLAGLAELPRLLAVHRLQLAAQLPLLGAQLPCSCLCRVELSFSCCRLYICMISTTIRSLSSSSPPAAATLASAPVSFDATSVTGDDNDTAGGGGVWAGVWVAFLQLWLLVSMETAWVWHSRSPAEAAAAARWDLASSAPSATAGDAWRSVEG